MLTQVRGWFPRRKGKLIMRAITAISATLLIGLSAVSGVADDSPANSVLVVLAHPDDELVFAPALAALARQGAQVRMLYATNGDAGPGVSDLPKGALLGEVRKAEAQCAGAALGVAAMLQFDRGDGRLGVDVHYPQSAARAFAEDIAPYLAENDLILTWGPDGGYGHGDHRVVSALVTQMVQALPAKNRPRLHYVGIPAGRLPAVPELSNWAVSDPALLTATIAYNVADLEAAKAAAQCHATQFDTATRTAMMPLFDATIWQGKVHFRPAF
jgi:LmbE family N-acetylglucosaminyl deacetylase